MNVEKEVAAMERMTVDQLRSKYAEVFQEPTRSRHKQYLIKRIAWRMQANAPDVLDVAKESKATKALYGIGEKATDTFGRQCLIARRLVERGVALLMEAANSQKRIEPRDVVLDYTLVERASTAPCLSRVRPGIPSRAIPAGGGRRA